MHPLVSWIQAGALHSGARPSGRVQVTIVSSSTIQEEGSASVSQTSVPLQRSSSSRGSQSSSPSQRQSSTTSSSRSLRGFAHVPETQTSSVQGLPSSQPSSALSGTGSFRQPLPSTQESVVQGLSSSQSGGESWTHFPSSQRSFPLHGSSSSQIPQLPPQLSSPHSLPVQLGTQMSGVSKVSVVSLGSTVSTVSFGAGTSASSPPGTSEGETSPVPSAFT